MRRMLFGAALLLAGVAIGTSVQPLAALTKYEQIEDMINAGSRRWGNGHFQLATAGLHLGEVSFLGYVLLDTTTGNLIDSGAIPLTTLVQSENAKNSTMLRDIEALKEKNSAKTPIKDNRAYKAEQETRIDFVPDPHPTKK